MYEVCPKKERREGNVQRFNINVCEHCSTQQHKKWGNPDGQAEQASPTYRRLSHNAQMIKDIDYSGQSNVQCPAKMSSKRTCEQGQQRSQMGKNRGAAATRQHRGTIEPEEPR